jgi:hypothetical protein
MMMLPTRRIRPLLESNLSAGAFLLTAHDAGA